MYLSTYNVLTERLSNGESLSNSEEALFSNVKPKSVISVMVIMVFIFEQVFWHFKGAMGFHCNRETTKRMTKRRLR